MTNAQKISLFLLRVTMGWMFFYAGYTKITNPQFTAAGYLNGAKAFKGFYGWLASPAMLPFVNFINGWGLTLLGVALMLGIGVKLSSKLGAILMILYYLPLGFPMPDTHSFIVDDHLIYAAGLLVLAATNAGEAWGLVRWCSNLPICSKFPRLRNWIG